MTISFPIIWGKTKLDIDEEDLDDDIVTNYLIKKITLILPYFYIDFTLKKKRYIEFTLILGRISYSLMVNHREINVKFIFQCEINVKSM